MPVQIPYINIFSGASRNKPQPSPPKPQQQRAEQERPLTPLPELDLAALTSSSPDLHMHTRGGMRYEYETAPLPVGIEYPASPLVGGARPGGAPTSRRRGTKAGETPLSPLAVATGLLGLKGRLGMPWRRNTAK
jgi:hypothetical protein